MYDIWSKNIIDNIRFVQQNAGPSFVVVVTGSQEDKLYWQEHLARTSSAVFREDGSTLIASVWEKTLKGNFLGAVNAWADAKQKIAESGKDRPNIALMSMVFGKGKRLSPFTQALGNRKSAFPTPIKATNAGVYLRTVDMANLYSNSWVQYLADRGFRGVILKWGDEALVPGVRWDPGTQDLRELDAVRLVWQTEPTEDLAREKEWIVIDPRTERMVFQFSRQDLGSLQKRVANLGEAATKVAVNLGSLAVSYSFLDTALKIFGEDIRDNAKWANWDPYVWIALCCADESQWREEIGYEDRMGQTGIRELESRYPDFYPKIVQLRAALESKTGRPLAIGILDFGETFWVDLGLHVTLRETFKSMTIDSDRGRATRELFRIPHERDRNGNTLVRSVIPENSDIRNSLIVDSIITDSESVVRRGVIIGGRHRQMHMPHGGSALFCAVDRMDFAGPRGVAFRSIGPEITIPEGGRHTTLLLPDGLEDMMSNESILDYSGRSYSQPILRNRLSFETAGKLMSKINGRDLEARWLRIWQGWV